MEISHCRKACDQSAADQRDPVGERINRGNRSINSCRTVVSGTSGQRGSSLDNAFKRRPTSSQSRRRLQTIARSRTRRTVYLGPPSITCPFEPALPALWRYW